MLDILRTAPLSVAEAFSPAHISTIEIFTMSLGPSFLTSTLNDLCIAVFTLMACLLSMKSL